MIKFDKPSLVALVYMVAVLCVQGHAQTNRKLVSQARYTARIDFECATSRYPKHQLATVVRRAMKGLDAGDFGVRGDRAVAFDLNKDGKPEYFIPLDCGATGNCSWGIFALEPARCLGTMPAENIYIEPSANWATLATYVHGSASEGSISVYKYSITRYIKTGGDFEVSADRKDFPKSMERAHSICEWSKQSKGAKKDLSASEQRT